MERYPVRRNGNEYYPKGMKGFVKRGGVETYARDRYGNQLYPRRKEHVFARSRGGKEYYARDKDGNETYPIVNDKSLLIVDPDTFEVKVALTTDGTERYPRDAKGNEYYLRRSEVPYLLKNGRGEEYLAKSRQGNHLIPWNLLQEHMDGDKPHVYLKDTAGNAVYANQTDFSPFAQALCNCICQFILMCPPITGIMALVV